MPADLQDGSSAMLWRHLQDWRERRRLRRHRADYYEYLSTLLQGLQGRQTLLDIFRTDAQRHGATSARGRVARQWARRYPLAGGDLSAAWAGCFPSAELAHLRAAQSLGNQALILALAQLADAVRLDHAARKLWRDASLTALVGLIVLLLVLALVPSFTVPRLLDAFHGVSPQHHGVATRRLVGLATFVQSHWLALGIAAAGTAGLMTWSLDNLAGALRSRLDLLPPWRLYRQIHGIRFLVLLRLTLMARDGEAVPLRAALVLQRQRARPWLASHLDRMLAMVDAGQTGAHSLDTGLLERPLFWFLEDMSLARGLAQGLDLTVARLRQATLHQVARQSLAWRWGMLLSCLSAILLVGAWHYAAIEELRRALLMLHAG